MIAAAVLFLGTLFLVTGLPLAWATRTRQEGWSALAADAFLYGSVVVSVGVTLWSWFGWVGLIVSALAALGPIAWIVHARPGLPALARPASWGIAAAWVVVLVVTLALRWHDVNFLPWVGDMGAYVNWANQFVRIGELTASWPPVFPAFLAITSAVFGTAGTTSGLAVTGLLLVVAIARVLQRLDVAPWIVVATGGLVAVNVHAIWFATFPGSESLNAPLFVLWISTMLLVLRATGRARIVPLLLSFLVVLDLCLLRGSGIFLLVPLALLAFGTLLIPSWRRWAVGTWAFGTANILAAAVSIWYGVTEIRPYFVTTQLGYLIPDDLFAAVESLGVLSPTPVLAGLLVVGVAVGVFFTWFSTRLTPVEADAVRGATRVIALLGAVALVALMALEAYFATNMWFIMLRTGVWVVVGGALALVLIAFARRLDDRVPVVALLGATTLLLTLFHTPRLGLDRIHAFFLYWDRYVFGEILPALIILTAVAAALLGERLPERLPRVDAVIRRAPAAVALVAVALAALMTLPRIVTTTQDSYMRGAHEFTQQLMTHAATDDAVLWGATSPDAAPGFFFPNTWMAFAIPMEYSFGYDFPNVSRGNYNFQPDDVLTAAQVSEVVAARGEVTVFETQTGVGSPLDERLADAGLTIERVTTETSDISLLAQTPVLEGWTRANIEVAIWRVTAG